MPRTLPSCTVALLLAMSASLPACSGGGDREDSHMGGAHVHYRPPVIDMADVMQAKLLHTQAIVEGLALGEMRQVAVNAESLHGLSIRASWMVHDTVTYVAMSETFRKRVQTLQQNAEAGNADAAMESYLGITQSCLDCHTYLREERLFKDAPGRRSMILDQLDVNAG